MRYLIRLLGICLLVLIPFFACMELDFGEPPEGCGSYDLGWPDGPSDPCSGVVCPPDDNECTREYCSGGSCRSEPVTNGRSCTYDGLSGVCVEGVCGENLCKDVVCDDGDACTVGTCDYVDGTCDFTPIVCDDYETCTEDTCDPADGCVFTAVEDGTVCDGPYGMCEAGSCVAPCDLASDEEYQCPITGLENLFCCPGQEYCRDDCYVPECQTHEDCDAGNECTEEYCSGDMCRSSLAPNGTPCDFGGGGTGGSGGSGGADGGGVCVNGVCGENLCEDVLCDDDDVCTHDSCDYVDGTCHFTPVVCNDDNPCTEEICDPADGCVFTAVEDGTQCGGSSPYSPRMCEAGSCVAPCDLASNEEYQCPITGLENLFCCPGQEYCWDDCYVPECQTHEDCDDNDKCTEDLCSGGACYFTPLCDDNNECTEDLCSDGTCVNNPVVDNTQCDFHGLPGLCISGRCADAELCEQVDCSDGDVCTDDVCDPADGSCDNPIVDDGTPCDEGLCIDGKCEPFGTVFPCTEQGIRTAIATGGGPYAFSCDGLTTVKTSAEIVVDNDVILDGEGKLKLDGNQAHRVLSVAAGTTAVIRGITFTGGATESSGAGVSNRGTLILTNCTVSGNTAGFIAGGVVNGGPTGTLTLNNCTVSGNTAHSIGGVYNNGAMTLNNCTVSGNAASFQAGGIYNQVDYPNNPNSSLTLTNSTVSGNTGEFGGGILNNGNLTLTNITVSGNAANRGSGIYHLSGSTLTVRNTLVDDLCYKVSNVTITSHGHNIENPANQCDFDHPTDQVNVRAPMLGPLQNNGGPTETHALLPGSVAIDWIPDSLCAVDTDQRGEPRPGGTMCDVGAFEVQP